MWNALDWFFHARVGQSACVLSGYARIFYAFLILCDKALWTVDFEFFFLSGRLPYEATSKDPALADSFTIFSLAPESDLLYLSLHILNMVFAGLLLLGIAPKIQLVLIHFCFLSFHNHNTLIWDGEDTMFRVWNFLMMFLPLHRVTIYDLLGTSATSKFRRSNNEEEESWPMWPFRLWQLEICFIYAGASMGKLSSERWKTGVALYHIIHITDFFGGAFTPDILYNRFGPLMLMTYASLVVESLCIIFIWPKATRFVTFCSVIALHIGIELSMNMHCFEFLAMLGWVFFLVEPKFQKPAEKSISRHAVTILLLILLALFAMDTAPFGEAYNVFPKSFHRSIRTMERAKYQVQSKAIYPFLRPIGLAQGVWNMFMGAPDEVITYEAVIRYYNDSVVVWNQPHWEDMNWLEKKRWQRPMTFYDTLADGHEWPIMEAITRGIANDHGGIDDIRSVVLSAHTDRPPPPNGLTFFDKAKQKRFRESTERLFALNLCDDLLPDCGQWAAVGDCSDPFHLKVMLDSCRRSCKYCFNTSVIHKDSRLALLYPHDMAYYPVTVVEMSGGGRRFRIEYDDYEDEDERYEWLDRIDMRERRFKPLARTEDPDMVEPSPVSEPERTEPAVGPPINAGLLGHRLVQLTTEVKVVHGGETESDGGELQLSEKSEVDAASEKLVVEQYEAIDPNGPSAVDNKFETSEQEELVVSLEPNQDAEINDQPEATGQEEEVIDSPVAEHPSSPIDEVTKKGTGESSQQRSIDLYVNGKRIEGNIQNIVERPQGTEQNDKYDYTNHHIKLNANVKINPGMVWLGSPATAKNTDAGAADLATSEAEADETSVSGRADPMHRKDEL